MADLDEDPNPNPVELPQGVEFSTAAIGRELGISQQAAAKILHRAIRKARQVLERRGMTLDDLIP